MVDKLEALVNRLEAAVGLVAGAAPTQAAQSSGSAPASGLGGVWTAATSGVCDKLKAACATLNQPIITQQCDLFIKMVG